MLEFLLELCALYKIHLQMQISCNGGFNLLTLC